ncbi:MAG: hypothetical protein ACREXX_04900 [Gammaproteobacteria bacterium]
MSKAKRLGEVETVDSRAYQVLALDAKVELIRALIPLAHAGAAALGRGGAVARRGTVCVEGYAGVRHGSNPRSVRLGGQRLPIRVPRAEAKRTEIPPLARRLDSQCRPEGRIALSRPANGWRFPIVPATKRSFRAAKRC